MKLSAPRWFIWLLALIAAALAIVSMYVKIPYIGGFVEANRFWFMTGAYGLLFLGTLFKGL
ncbi:MAG: hypothetical protein LLF75_01865 [Eubacteriales bacterium]|nr:hypothetical protein [Eubacteriales bacterium]